MEEQLVTRKNTPELLLAAASNAQPSPTVPVYLEAIKTVGFPIVMCFVLMYLVFKTIPEELGKLSTQIREVNNTLVANQTTLTSNQSTVIANQNLMIRNLEALQKLLEKLEHK